MIKKMLLLMFIISCTTGAGNLFAQVINQPVITTINNNVVKDLQLNNKINSAFPQPSKTDWPEIKKGSNGLVPRFVPAKPEKISIDPKKTVAGVFVIKFAEGSHIRMKDGVLQMQTPEQNSIKEEQERLSRAGVRFAEAPMQLEKARSLISKAASEAKFEISYLFRSKEELNKKDEQFVQKSELEQRATEELADLDLYYVMYAKDFKDIKYEEELLNQFNSLAIVEQTYPVMITEGAVVKTDSKPMSFLPPTPDISGMQGYLNPAPTGLDSRFAWTRPGGRGDGVRVIDVEYDWVTDHEDFPASRFWGGRSLVAPYVREGSEHGTAVLGVLASPHNGLGIAGMAPNISHGLSSVLRPADYAWGAVVASFSGENWTGRCHNVAVAGAIGSALGALTPGNVILIEQHVPGPGTGRTCPGCNCSQWEYVAMEYYQECFDVIRRATASGVIVVEAAGNGGQNLDAPVYGNRFNMLVRNSQAILVGASNAGDRMPACFSNTANRVDVHAWGDAVVTLGYGDGSGASAPFNNGVIRQFYTRSFGGTSSASPMVTASVASVQGARIAAGLLPFSPVSMRNLLVSTGTPQVSGSHIGPQPNLRTAITSTLAVRGGYTGPGVYTIRAKSSRKVFDIDVSWWQGGNNGQKLQQWDSHGGSNQQFSITELAGGYIRIMAVHSGKVLDVESSSLTDGARIIQYSSHGGNNQQFSLRAVGSYYQIVCRQSGKVLDVNGYSTSNGAQIQQWTSHGGDNQLFELIRIR